MFLLPWLPPLGDVIPFLLPWLIATPLFPAVGEMNVFNAGENSSTPVLKWGRRLKEYTFQSAATITNIYRHSDHTDIVIMVDLDIG